ncbi:MAG: hypothetical protein D6805_01180 [Planctomycetota bacterium]|nr:MAG: hypothetical protein D6805_01180 [Planctomycetota bacterium]
MDKRGGKSALAGLRKVSPSFFRVSRLIYKFFPLGIPKNILRIVAVGDSVLRFLHRFCCFFSSSPAQEEGWPYPILFSEKRKSLETFVKQGRWETALRGEP